MLVILSPQIYDAGQVWARDVHTFLQHTPLSDAPVVRRMITKQLRWSYCLGLGSSWEGFSIIIRRKVRVGPAALGAMDLCGRIELWRL